MNMETIPGRADDNVFPIPVVTLSGWGNLLAATSKDLSIFLTGIWCSDDNQTFTIIRQNHPLLGSGGLLTLADHGDLEMASDDFLILFWFKATNTGTTYMTKSTGNDSFSFETTAAGLPKFTITDSGSDSASVTGTKNVNDGEWHQIGISGDRNIALGLTIYVDGVLNGTQTSGDLTDVGSVTGGATALIWTGPAAGLALSTFAIYHATDAFTLANNVALTEVVRTYNEGVGLKFTGSETDITWAANLDEGTGATCVSNPAGGSDGTLSVDYTWTAGGVPWQSVKDKTVAMPNLFELRTDESFTFPHAIKIGRSCPLDIKTSGAADFILFGFIT